MKPLSRFSRKLLGVLLLFYVLTTSILWFAVTPITRQIFLANLEERSALLMSRLPKEGDFQDLVHFLNNQKERLFFRVTLFGEQGQLLYESVQDSSTLDSKGVSQAELERRNFLKNNEVRQALDTGHGYSQHYSNLTSQAMAYVARSFDYGGLRYVIRTSSPLEPLLSLESNLHLAIVCLTSLVFLCLTFMLWRMVTRLNRPLSELLKTLPAYQKLLHNPKHKLPKFSPKNAGDFEGLIKTLNLLAKQMQHAKHDLSYERSEKEALLESMTDGVVALDRKLQVVYVNPALSNVFHAPTDNWIDHPFPEKEFAPIAQLLRQCQKKREVISEEVTLQRDIEITTDVLISPKVDASGYMMVARDRTAAAKLLEMRRSFVANASHELKTPITIIRGFAETLHDNIDLPKKIVSDITEKILRNCHRMEELIRSLLSLAAVEQFHAEDLYVCNLPALTQEALEELSDLSQNAQVTLHCNDPKNCQIQGKADLLNVVLVNLIENALKYSQEPKEIQIKIENTENEVTWEIQDNGIGIPKEDLPYIFERFYTVDKARSKKMGGYGLGLSLVRAIVRKLGGTIEVSSSLQEGSAFTLTFPNN